MEKMSYARDKMVVVKKKEVTNYEVSNRPLGPLVTKTTPRNNAYKHIQTNVLVHNKFGFAEPAPVVIAARPSPFYLHKSN
jgi:hypothetical protein